MNMFFFSRKQKNREKKELYTENLEECCLAEFRENRMKTFVSEWLFTMDKNKKDLAIYLFYFVAMLAIFLFFRFGNFGSVVNAIFIVPAILVFSSFLSMEARRKRGEKYYDCLSLLYLNAISQERKRRMVEERIAGVAGKEEES